MKLIIFYVFIGISIFLLAQNYDQSGKGAKTEENKKSNKSDTNKKLKSTTDKPTRSYKTKDNANEPAPKDKKRSSKKSINNDKKRFSKEGIEEYQRIMNFKKKKDAQKVQSEYICYDSYGQRFTDKDPGFVQCLKELEKKEKHHKVMPNGSGAGGAVKIRLGD